MNMNRKYCCGLWGTAKKGIKLQQNHSIRKYNKKLQKKPTEKHSLFTSLQNDVHFDYFEQTTSMNATPTPASMEHAPMESILSPVHVIQATQGPHVEVKI